MSEIRRAPERAGVSFSASTWRQPPPPATSPDRVRTLTIVAELIDGLGDQRRRVAIDGRTAAGKSTFGDELAHALAARGRRVLRASLDDFKRPWREAHRYDRQSGEGYYRNALDCSAARALLLEPAAPAGSGAVALCSIDPLTQVDHSSTTTRIPPAGVLIVDGTFACRPELDDCWDLRVWLDVPPDVALARGTARDAAMEGGIDAAEALHRDRYAEAERLYIDEVDPMALVQVIVDNQAFDHPRLVRLPA